MARPKKTEADTGGQLMSSADIIWMRDNVITGLSNLENGVHELRRTYITYFNSRLPEGHPARLNVPFFPAIYPGENGAARPRAETPAAVLTVEAGGKRKRKPHDPNAPKRALTSYFLFMQDHKPQIKEAHPDWTAAQISAESEKRWENISEEEKADYDMRYQVDLCRYYKQKEAYEAGEPIPEISAGEAQTLYDEQVRSGQPPKGRKVGKAPAQTTAAPAQEAGKSDDSSSEEEEASPEPVKAVTPPKTDRASKRQKTAKDNEAAKAVPAKAAKGKAVPDSPKVDRATISPEVEKKKKAAPKKKDTKVDEEAGEEAEVAESSPVKGKGGDKKEKKPRKKRKSEAVMDDA